MTDKYSTGGNSKSPLQNVVNSQKKIENAPTTDAILKKNVKTQGMKI